MSLQQTITQGAPVLGIARAAQVRAPARVATTQKDRQTVAVTKMRQPVPRRQRTQASKRM